MSNPNKSKPNETEDAESMRLAFEAFMLSGKNNKPSSTPSDQPSAQLPSGSKKKKKKKRGNAQSPAASKVARGTAAATEGSELDDESTVSSILSPAQSPRFKSGSISFSSPRQPSRKRYYQLVRSFSDKVQNSWMEIDDQLLSVIENIVSIRGRLPHEWSLLHSPQMKHKQLEAWDTPESGRLDTGALGNDEWKYFGLQGKPKEDSWAFHLNHVDVQLALSHDLTQHEKMLVGLRSLMSDLAECHDSLGRVVDTLWQFHLEYEVGLQHEVKEEFMGTESEDFENIVQNVTEVFHMLSRELLRKQHLVDLVTESVNDGLFGSDLQHSLRFSGVAGEDTDETPLQVAKKCFRAWPRSTIFSCLDEKVMMSVLSFGIQNRDQY